MSKTLLIRVCSNCSVGWAKAGIPADRPHTAGARLCTETPNGPRSPTHGDPVNENQMHVTQATGLVLLSGHRYLHPQSARAWFYVAFQPRKSSKASQEPSPWQPRDGETEREGRCIAQLQGFPETRCPERACLPGMPGDALLLQTISLLFLSCS